MLIFGALMVVVGSAVFLNHHNKTTRYQLQNVIARMELDAALTSAQGGIRRALLDYPTSGCAMPPDLSQSRLYAFRRYDNSAPLIEFDLRDTPSNPQLTNTDISCLMTPEEKRKLGRLKVKVMELINESNFLMRKVEVMVEAESKAKPGVIVRTAKISRTYQVQPLTLSRFGLLFHTPSDDGPFIELGDERAKLRVFSNVLYSFNENPSWAKLLPPASGRITFERNNFARFSAIDSSEALSLKEFRATYRNGIQTGVLKPSFVNTYLPDASRSWNHRYDYGPLYHNTSYAIPEGAGGEATMSYCTSDTPTAIEVFSPTRAELNVVPTPTPADQNGPVMVKDTCKPGMVPSAFIFMQKDRDLTIRLKPGDANFCGMVVANTLTVEIDSTQPYIYGLLGNFFVKHLVIKNLGTIVGDGLSEVRIYNPSDNPVTDGLEPMDQTINQLGVQLRKLGSSTARNFFIPISQSGALRPWYPSSTYAGGGDQAFLRQCPASSYYSMQLMYKTIADMPSVFPPYQQDSAGSIYAVEAF